MHLTEEEYDDSRISFTAESILSQIASSNSQIWEKLSQKDTNRNQVLKILNQTVCRWKTDWKLNSNFSSLAPFLNMLGSDQDIHEVQQWSLWNLIDLTRVEGILE
jgi:hypothetical protein